MRTITDTDRVLREYRDERVHDRSYWTSMYKVMGHAGLKFVTKGQMREVQCTFAFILHYTFLKKQ